MIFPDALAKDLATAAVVCISPAVAWMTYSSGRRGKGDEERRRRLGELETLRAQLDTIGAWAGNENDYSTYDPHLAGPMWSVKKVPSDYIERFNRIVLADEFPRPVSSALARLEAAASQFHALLEEIRMHSDKMGWDARLRIQTAVDPPIRERKPLFDVLAAATNDESERNWLLEFYRLHKV